MVPAEPGGADRIKTDGSHASGSHPASADCDGGDQQSADVHSWSHHHADPSSIPLDLFERLEQQVTTAERVPNAEISETEAGYTVRLELPGVDRDSIDIKATDRNLVITAERPSANTDDNNAPLLSEFRSGTWSRSFRFPHSLDRDQLRPAIGTAF